MAKHTTAQVDALHDHFLKYLALDVDQAPLEHLTSIIERCTHQALCCGVDRAIPPAVANAFLEIKGLAEKVAGCLRLLEEERPVSGALTEAAPATGYGCQGISGSAPGKSPFVVLWPKFKVGDAVTHSAWGRGRVHIVFPGYTGEQASYVVLGDDGSHFSAHDDSLAAESVTEEAPAPEQAETPPPDTSTWRDRPSML